MHSHPTKVKVLEVQSTDVRICCTNCGQESLVGMNDLVRRVDNGAYDLQNFIEHPDQFDLCENEQNCWREEELELKDFDNSPKAKRLFKPVEVMA